MTCTSWTAKWLAFELVGSMLVDDAGYGDNRLGGDRARCVAVRSGADTGRCGPARLTPRRAAAGCERVRLTPGATSGESGSRSTTPQQFRRVRVRPVPFAGSIANPYVQTTFGSRCDADGIGNELHRDRRRL